MTPVWVLLVVAVITALGGAAVGAFINDRGARAREAIAWDRELDRERLRWEREDDAREHQDRQRTFTERRTAYGDMLGAVEAAMNDYRRGSHNSPGTSDIPDHVTATLKPFSTVQIFGSTEVVALAGECWKRIVLTHIAVMHGDNDPEAAADDVRQELDALGDAQQKFLVGVRADLGIARVPATG